MFRTIAKPSEVSCHIYRAPFLGKKFINVKFFLVLQLCTKLLHWSLLCFLKSESDESFGRGLAILSDRGWWCRELWPLARGGMYLWRHRAPPPCQQSGANKSLGRRNSRIPVPPQKTNHYYNGQVCNDLDYLPELKTLWLIVNVIILRLLWAEKKLKSDHTYLPILFVPRRTYKVVHVNSDLVRPN